MEVKKKSRRQLDEEEEEFEEEQRRRKALMAERHDRVHRGDDGAQQKEKRDPHGRHHA